MKVAWSASALAAVAAVLAGCGGGSSKPAASQLATAQRSAGAVRVSPSGVRVSPSAVRVSPSAVTLSASANGPTTCTVYESGYATQVVFESPDLDVRAECLEWTRYKPGEGYLWGYEPMSATTKAVGSTRVCYLINPHANSTASVIQATGFRPVSGVERANASSACSSLIASGWIAQVPVPRHRRHRHS